MKRGAKMLVISVLLLAACQYISPLEEEHKIPIDPAVLGFWKPIHEKERKPDQAEELMVMKFSETEYVIFIGGIFFRGYPINVGGIPCVQLQMIASWDGPVKKAEKNLFHVATYQFENGELTVKHLNEKLLDNMLNCEDLRKEFLKHKDNKNLFTEPLKFRRMAAHRS